MPITGTDSTLLRAFIKQCKKITSNFDEASLTKMMPILENYLLSDNKQYDLNKFKPNTEYYDILFAYHVLRGLKNTNKIFNTFMLASNKVRSRKKKRKLPSNWKVIQGGKA